MSNAHTESKSDKIDRLLRFHRQRVFGANGDAHARAIARIKRTRIYSAVDAARRAAASHRASERLLRLYD